MTIRHIAPFAAMSVASSVLLFAGPVQAAEPIVVAGAFDPDQIVRHVGYADLNLVSVAGQATLSRRVSTAIGGLCDEATGGDDGSLRVRTAFARCGAVAWNGASPQIAIAVQRAQEIAMTGSSKLVTGPVTITL